MDYSSRAMRSRNKLIGKTIRSLVYLIYKFRRRGTGTGVRHRGVHAAGGDSGAMAQRPRLLAGGAARPAGCWAERHRGLARP